MASFDYVSFSPRQLDVIECDLARITILEGSVRSGKTIASIVRWAYYVGTETSPEAKLLMLGVTADTLYRNVISDLLDIVGPAHASYKDGLLTLFGRTVYCVGARDVGAEKRIRGLTVEGCYIDEVTQIPEAVVKQAIMRCSKGQGRLIWTTNPDSPFHWAHTEYVANKQAIATGRVKVYHFNLDDNYALGEAYKEDLKAGFTGLWHKRMVLGLWVLAEGVIYDGFNLDAHGFDDDQAPAFDHLNLVFDYGTQNPFHALLVGVKGDVSWFIDEWRYCGRERQKQMTDGEYSAALKVWLGDRKVRKVLHDPSATSMAVQLKKDSWPGLTAAKNDVMPGISVVANRMNGGKLRIHRTRCPHLVRELGIYAWDPKASQRGEDVPIKQNDHGADAARYHEFTLFGEPARKVVTMEDLMRHR